MRFPSLRDARKLLRVGRNTVAEVYEQLVNEGYVVARQGSGTYVAIVSAGGQKRAKRVVVAR